MAPRPIPEAKFIEAIHKGHGVPLNIAKILKITAHGVRKRLRGNKRLQEIADTERENVNDIAKDQLIRKIKAGNLDAIKYWLSRNCKKEFTTRMEVQHSGTDGDAKVVLFLPDNGRDGYKVDGNGQIAIEGDQAEPRSPDDGASE